MQFVSSNPKCANSDTSAAALTRGHAVATSNDSWPGNTVSQAMSCPYTHVLHFADIQFPSQGKGWC